MGNCCQRSHLTTYCPGSRPIYLTSYDFHEWREVAVSKLPGCEAQYYRRRYQANCYPLFLSCDSQSPLTCCYSASVDLCPRLVGARLDRLIICFRWFNRDQQIGVYRGLVERKSKISHLLKELFDPYDHLVKI